MEASFFFGSQGTSKNAWIENQLVSANQYIADTKLQMPLESYAVSIIKVLSHTKLSRLNSKINFRLNFNLARLIMIKILSFCHL